MLYSNKTICEKVFTINDIHQRLHAGHMSCWLSGGQTWWSVPESETQHRLYTSMTACAWLKSTPAPLASLLACTGPAPRHISWPQIFIWGWRRMKLRLFWCSFASVWARKSHSRAGKTWIRIRKSGVKLVGRRSSPCHRRTGLSAEVRRADWRGGGGETEEQEQPYGTCNVFRHWCTQVRGRGGRRPKRLGGAMKAPTAAAAGALWSNGSGVTFSSILKSQR